MKNIAIITARANSKGVQEKNMRSVGGISLVGRAIQAAKETRLFSDIVVTTDGDAIAHEARRFGATVVRRPAEYATDDARSIDAVRHALDAIDAIEGICVLLQPTSPLRTSEDIASAVEMRNMQETGSIISVCECEHHPYKTFVLQKGAAIPAGNLEFMDAPRQTLPKMYRPNGAIYVNNIKDLRAAHSFFIQPIGLYEMPAARSIDIDSELDLIFANLVTGD